MVMDLLRGRGKDAPGPEEHVTEIEGVRRDVADLETQIAEDEAVAALEQEAAEKVARLVFAGTANN